MESPSAVAAESAVFDALDEARDAGGAEAALERLIDHLEATNAYRPLLDALLLKARHDLGLPLVPVGSLNDLAEPMRSRYEERYVAAIRRVGEKLLEAGEIPTAWSYFRAIGEPDPVTRAIDAYQPAEGDERLGSIIDVALHQGANPRKGFALILEHYGTCSAITAFEGLPQDQDTRIACADGLVRQLHEHLTANLRADIAQRSGDAALPPEGTGIAALLEGRDELLAEEAYHIDVSHLSSVVRLAPMLTDPAALTLAWELTEYGRRLSERHQYEGDPPFEDTYVDHGIYIGALIGRDVEGAIAHFRAKLTPPDPERPGDSFPAQVLVSLLLRLDRLDEAIDVAGEHLAMFPESVLMCPSAAQLCQRAGRPDRLARIARAHGDPVNYTAAILQQAGAVAGTGEGRS